MPDYYFRCLISLHRLFFLMPDADASPLLHAFSDTYAAITACRLIDVAYATPMLDADDVSLFMMLPL